MSRERGGSAIARHLVVVLDTGATVICWEPARVQDVLTGSFVPVVEPISGRPVLDHELEQLKTAGHVVHFTSDYVWVRRLPDVVSASQAPSQADDGEPVRGYYLNTTLHADELETVRSRLASTGLGAQLTAQAHNGWVAIVGGDGRSFLSLNDAEAAQQALQARAPDLLNQTVIAFVDRPACEAYPGTTGGRAGLDLAAIIDSQTDTTLTAGRRAIVVSGSADDRETYRRLLADMRLVVRAAGSVREALEQLEDGAPDLLLTDLRLPDAHAWQMILKAREIVRLNRLITVIIAEQDAAPGDETLGLGVARVDAYLVKPVSPARLRQAIWLAFRYQNTNPNGG